VKTAEQQNLQAIHRIRDEIKSHRIAREIKEDRKTPVQDTGA
jgi:hypothetical protein